MLAWILVFSSLSSHAAIYGTDSRRDVPTHPFANSVAMQIPLNYVSPGSPGHLNFDFSSLSDPQQNNFCAEEAFAAQKVSPIACTGFLVGPDLLVTAGHCAVNWTKVKNVVTPQCEAFGWLFDYRLGENGELPPTNEVPTEKLVRCREVVYANFEIVEKHGKIAYGEDIALIRLERALPERTPLPLAKASPGLATKLSMLGHPLGLPLKFATGVVLSQGRDSFRTDLDVQGGNSGSAVFNAEGKVTGVLVRSFPDADFVEDRAAGCARWNRCPEGSSCLSGENLFYARGSEVQRIQGLLPHLPR